MIITIMLFNFQVCHENMKREEIPAEKTHMKCEVTGRPCCIGTQAQCIITSQAYCKFKNGVYHKNKTLCSQVRNMKIMAQKD